MDWKKYFCPVCGVDFNDEDDVVVCPECGTPHHRECWNKNGRCSNENLHDTEDSLECTYMKAGEVEEPAPQQSFTADPGAYDPQTSAPYNSEPAGFNPFNTAENKQAAPQMESYTINGKPSVLYEIAVKKNQKYYIPRFLMMDRGLSGTGWNFLAFIFPLAWSLYRKVYKLTAIILAVYVAIFAATCLTVYMDKPLWNSMMECVEEDPEFSYKVIAYTNGESGATLTPKQQEYLKEQEEYNQLIDQPRINVIIYWGTMILGFALKIFTALAANKMYFKRINRSIDIGEKIGLQGDALKTYVYRKNGTLPMILVAIVGLLEFMG